MGDRGKSSEGVQSVRKAFALLRILSTGGDAGVRLKDLTEESGLPNSTVHRMMRLLVDEGVAEQHALTRRYSIGEEVAVLAMASSAHFPIQAVAREHMVRLAHDTGDAVALTVRRGLDALCIDRVMGDSPIQVLSIRKGDRRPLGATLASQAILAGLSDDELSAIIQANDVGLRRFGVTAERVRERVAQVRALGYAYADKALVRHTSGIAVPVRNAQGDIVAALSIVTILERMPAARIAQLHTLLDREANSLSERIGKAGLDI